MFKIKKENDFWSPENTTEIEEIRGINSSKSCKLCQCLNGKLECYSKSCRGLRFPTYAHVKVKFGKKTRIDARIIPFFADILKSIKRYPIT